MVTMPGRLIGLLRRLGHVEASPDRPPRAASSSVTEPVRTARGDDVREFEFAAYAEDCRLFGFFQLGAERLSDALNEVEQIQLTDVLVAALSDGRVAEARQLTVERRELLAVRAAGPRGNQGRRGRTRPFPVTLQSGPYTIHGHLHALPGADPIKQLRRRPAMVPLTEAWIEYASSGVQHRARVGTIIVNRELLDWIRPSRDNEVGLPDLPMETAPDPQAKDLTGYLYATTPADRAGAR